jgi:hypothetical protein
MYDKIEGIELFNQIQGECPVGSCDALWPPTRSHLKNNYQNAGMMLLIHLMDWIKTTFSKMVGQKGNVLAEMGNQPSYWM